MVVSSPVRRPRPFGRIDSRYQPKSLLSIQGGRVDPSVRNRCPVFTKILVANRGEIAIRAFRAAYELGAQTVAVFPYEDRNSLHRQKADEAYQIGVQGHPVRAYLDIAEIIRVAKESGADAIYPGYGFLSENQGLARAWQIGLVGTAGPASWYRHSGDPEPARV